LLKNKEEEETEGYMYQPRIDNKIFKVEEA